MNIFIWIFFLAGTLVNLWYLARLDVRRLDFIDGVLIGNFYFIVIPLAFFLVSGVTQNEDLQIAYRPYIDLETTAILLIGMFLLPLLRVILPRPRGDLPDRTDPMLFYVVLLLFLLTAIVSFQLSGLGQGGHWQKNLADAFEDNPLFVFVKQASNIARTVIFGLLVYQHATRRMSFGIAVLIGLAIALLDLFLTFNRITAVYLLLAVLMMLRRNVVRLAVAAVSLTLLSSVSLLWPIFRSFATTGGYSLDSLRRAADLASGQAGGGGLDAALNGVFESSNLIVLNWIVEHFGQPSYPLLHGEMIVRAATVLIPKSIWPGRPDGFGPQIGMAITSRSDLALNSTMYGEAFANFGWAWPVALAGFLVACHLLFRAIGRRWRGVDFMAAFVAIALWRFDTAFVGVAIVIVAGLVGLVRFYRLSFGGAPRSRGRRMPPPVERARPS